MIRRILLAASLLALAGCTTYGGYYDSYDRGYYDGYGYDRGYYDEPHYDGYGAYPYDYDDYYSYDDYGWSSYGCGWYGCAPHYGSHFGFSFSYGNAWSPWGWAGSPWWAYPGYGYGYGYPYRPHEPGHPDRPDPKPRYADSAGGTSVTSAPGERVWPQPSRAPSRPGVTGPGAPRDPGIPMAKPVPRDRYAPGTSRPSPRLAPEPGTAPSSPRYARPRTPEPETAAPRYAPRPQPRYAQPDAPRSQPRYDAPRPQPRYDAPRQESPRHEAPRQESPRYEPPQRETRPASQNANRDDER